MQMFWLWIPFPGKVRRRPDQHQTSLGKASCYDHSRSGSNNWRLQQHGGMRATTGKTLTRSKADVVLIHGLNGLERKTYKRHQVLGGHRRPANSKKLVLHQGQHVYVHNVRSLDFLDMMNLWLT